MLKNPLSRGPKHAQQPTSAPKQGAACKCGRPEAICGASPCCHAQRDDLFRAWNNFWNARLSRLNGPFFSIFFSCSFLEDADDGEDAEGAIVQLGGLDAHLVQAAAVAAAQRTKCEQDNNKEKWEELLGIIRLQEDA